MPNVTLLDTNFFMHFHIKEKFTFHADFEACGVSKREDVRIIFRVNEHKRFYQIKKKGQKSHNTF